MKLTIFESDAGDCLLLEAKSKHLMLCDGGMKASLQKHVRAELSRLERALDLVYVSHIDNDHISGVLQLLEDEAEWRVFDLHEANGDPIRRPKVPRPPKIKGILHNAFRDQVEANEEESRDMLVAAAPALYASAVTELIRAGDRMEGIAAGIPEAMKVSRLIAPDALDIPLNKPPGVNQQATLLLAGRPGEKFALGSMQFTLIGPTNEELTRLGKGWNTWLKENPEKVEAIRAELKKRIEDFSNGALTASPYDLRDWNGIPDLKGVTAPNVASLMFMVEEDGKTLLLTGDAQQDVILAGLQSAGFLKDGHVHLDALKVQHHGSEHNMDPEFARKVSADNYVFCGNGLHGNPEKAVIDMIFASRLGRPQVRALAPEARDRPFHFWFSTTSQAAPEGLERREVFAGLEAHVADLARRSHGRLELHFNAGASTILEL